MGILKILVGEYVYVSLNKVINVFYPSLKMRVKIVSVKLKNGIRKVVLVAIPLIWDYNTKNLSY